MVEQSTFIYGAYSVWEYACALQIAGPDMGLVWRPQYRLTTKGASPYKYLAPDGIDEIGASATLRVRSTCYFFSKKNLHLLLVT
jgi:hypothetical protein